MRTRLGLFCLLLLLTLVQAASGDPPHSEEWNIEKIRAYLAVKYDELETRPNGVRCTYGLAFDDRAKLSPLDTPKLAAFLPKTRFYTTELHGPSFCYLRVKTLVAITAGESDDIRGCLSPTYGDTSGKFLAMFQGISAPTEADKKALTLGIGELLASLTHEGEVRSQSAQSCEVWHRGHRLLNLELWFDKNAICSRVFRRSPNEKAPSG